MWHLQSFIKEFYKNYQHQRVREEHFGSGNSICEGTESCHRTVFAEKGVVVLCVGVKAT